MSWLIQALLTALISVLTKFLVWANEKRKVGQAERRQDDAERAVLEGDTYETEKLLDSPHAGRPSGRGRLREKEADRGNDVGGGIE